MTLLKDLKTPKNALLSNSVLDEIMLEKNLKSYSTDLIENPKELFGEVLGIQFNIEKIPWVNVNYDYARQADVDIDIFTESLHKKLKELTLNTGNYYEITGSAQENMQARNELITQSLLAGGAVLLLLYIAFGSFTNLCLTVLNLPFALIGGVLAASFTGGWISIGSLVGFVTLFGITLRNTIMLISHYQFLINEENCTWNLETSIRGAKERLPSILMTALVAGLALTPIAFGSDQPGKEIEGPMAMIIIGGLFTSTILNLLILPTILLNYGSFKKLIQR